MLLVTFVHLHLGIHITLLESLEILTLHLLILKVKIFHLITMSVWSIAIKLLSIIIGILIHIEIVHYRLNTLIIRKRTFLTNTKNIIIVFRRNSFRKKSFTNFKKNFRSQQSIRTSLMLYTTSGNVKILSKSA